MKEFFFKSQGAEQELASFLRDMKKVFIHFRQKMSGDLWIVRVPVFGDDVIQSLEFSITYDYDSEQFNLLVVVNLDSIDWSDEEVVVTERLSTLRPADCARKIMEKLWEEAA